MAEKREPSVRTNVLKILSEKDGYISGQEISMRLNLSRTAVWKHIKELRGTGYDIESVKKSGYRLVHKPNAISATELHTGLKTTTFGHSIVYRESVSSTQQLAHKLAHEGAKTGTVVTADEQVKGKGRLGRPWHSPKAKGIWTSLILRPEIPPQQAPQLTLLAAVAVVKGTKKATGIDCEIKWPNDILINGKKIVGILTELQAEPDKVNAVIVGMGINVNTTREEFPEELREKATSLMIENGGEIDRAHLLQHILEQMEGLYETYLKEGFGIIKLMWESYAVSIGKNIIARTLKGETTGIAKGITEDGFLMLEDNHGTLHYVSSADIELS
jgi:BirA family biotin operon repressor/biotin-[acetyl-CoA-carboxylase] ligase